MRLLFCLPTTALSGGVKVVFEFANRLTERGVSVDIFSYAGPPQWFSLKARLLEARSIEAVPMPEYDFVFLSNAFMIPLVLPLVAPAQCVFFCLDYESFHHGKGRQHSDFMTESPTFVDIYKLPVPIMAESRPVRQLIRERTGRDAYYLPMAIDRSIFFPRPPKPREAVKRIVMVGNYLMPYKGIPDGLEALRLLAAEMPVQLVLITQERRSRTLFDDLPFPIEIHYCPTQDRLPEIYTSCDVYCCTSWYEGLGLPAIECFRCGVPVVSTRTYGVLDYGVDSENLLLASPNDPPDLCDKLRRLLLDEPLADRLRGAAFQTAERHYDWDTSVARFLEIITDIDRTYEGPGSVDPRVMQDLLSRLENEGNLTPITVFNEYRRLADDLSRLVQRLLEKLRPAEQDVTVLEELRDGFRQYIGNEAAEYYDAFRSKYDLCQLLYGLKDTPRFVEYLTLLTTRDEPREPHTAASFSEIRYI